MGDSICCILCVRGMKKKMLIIGVGIRSCLYCIYVLQTEIQHSTRGNVGADLWHCCCYIVTSVHHSDWMGSSENSNNLDQCCSHDFYQVNIILSVPYFWSIQVVVADRYQLSKWWKVDADQCRCECCIVTSVNEYELWIWNANIYSVHNSARTIGLSDFYHIELLHTEIQLSTRGNVGADQ